MKIIQADKPLSWPRPLQDALATHVSEIAAYQRERIRIDRAAQKNDLLRVQRPHNPHQASWDAVLDIANSSIVGARLLGFHATRLTGDEIDDIKDNGMKVLSAGLVVRRLAKLQADGALPPAVIDTLRANNQAASSNRSGRTCFCFSRTALRSEGGMRRLLQSWGGEAMYWSYEDDPVIGTALRSIGTPSIVIAAIPVENIRTHFDLGELLVNIWCAKRRIRTGYEAGFEGHTRTNVAASEIVRVVEFSDPEFQKLTCHSKWRQPLP